MNKNNNKPKLSIILPTYNREKYIKRSIESILHQTFSDWELIIVDDGSTDQSLKICNDYMQKDTRIKVFHTENFGVSHARNVGLDNMSGEWFAFIDSDDEYLPDAFETMFKYANDVDMVITMGIRIPSYSICKPCSTKPIKFKPDESFSIECLKNFCYNSPWAKIFNSKKINHRFDESMQKCEDTVFGLEAVSKATYISYVPQIIYRYYSYSELSLNYIFYISQLYCSKRLYETCLKYFNNKDAQIWSCDNFANISVNYFANLVFNNKLPKPIKEEIILEQINNNLLLYLNNLKHATVEHQYENLWKTIINGNPTEIIDEYNKQKDLFMFTDKDYQSNDLNDANLNMNKFNINIAGINIEISHKYDCIKEKCKNYIVNHVENPNIKVFVQNKRIEYSKQYRLYFDGETIDDGYAEYDALPYRFYGKLPKFDAFWLHAVVIEKDSVAYAFSAQPGVGKSTHAKLWLKAFPDAQIIDGDNPIIRFNSNDGKFYAYGTPFCGKEGYNINKGVPLKAVCFLERGDKNEIYPIKREFVIARLLNDNFCIDEYNGQIHYDLYNKFIEKTAFYSLRCNMDIEAAKIAFKAMV